MHATAHSSLGTAVRGVHVVVLRKTRHFRAVASSHTQPVELNPSTGNGGQRNAATIPQPSFSSVTHLGPSTLPFAPAAAVPVASPECSTPPATFQKIVALAVAKANTPVWQSLLAGIFAGAFIGFGAAVSFAVGGACPGLAATNPGLQRAVSGFIGLPFALTMVLVSGSDLFTGNTAVLTAGLLQGKVKPRQLLMNWLTSYTGNLIGSLAVAAAFWAANTFAGSATPMAVATAKTSFTFGQAFTRGLLCNWMVCMAVWQASAASSFAGKFLAVSLPISAFVSLGLEHSVANMFMVPMGMLCGAPVTVSHFLMSSLLPVTLGNVVGGVVLVGMAMNSLHGAHGVQSLTGCSHDQATTEAVCCCPFLSPFMTPWSEACMDRPRWQSLIHGTFGKGRNRKEKR